MMPRSLNSDSAATQGEPITHWPSAGASLGSVAAVAIPLILIAIFLPQLVGAFWLRAFTSSAIFALASVGVALLYGRLGLVSLAQVALLGVGAWVALRLSHGTDLPFELVLLGGGIAAGLVGLIIGLPALRMRGLYLALITLMAAGGFQVIVGGTGFPDGGPGFLGRVSSASARQLMERPFIAQTDIAYFRYVLVIVAAGFLLVELQRRTRPGRAWALIRKSEACALSAGVNVTFYKTWAFTLAGFLAGIAGGLMAGSVGQLDGRTFLASDSILIFALTVVGGVYSWFGPAITGLLFRAFPSLLNDWGVDGNLAYIVFGAALLHALMTAPAGIAGQPRVVLMDEPGAGLSQTESEELQAIIKSIPDHYGAMVVLIDHDVSLIAATCTSTAVLDFGSLITYGPTEVVLRDDRVKAAYLGTEEVL